MRSEKVKFAYKVFRTDYAKIYGYWLPSSKRSLLSPHKLKVNFSILTYFQDWISLSRRKSLQSPEERMLVMVLISIVILFVCCTTPAGMNKCT